MSNKEIIRFANWWLGATNWDNWNEKKEEFYDFVDQFEKQPFVAFVDESFQIIIDRLSYIPNIHKKIKAVGVII